MSIQTKKQPLCRLGALPREPATASCLVNVSSCIYIIAHHMVFARFFNKNRKKTSPTEKLDLIGSIIEQESFNMSYLIVNRLKEDISEDESTIFGVIAQRELRTFLTYIFSHYIHNKVEILRKYIPHEDIDDHIVSYVINTFNDGDITENFDIYSNMGSIDMDLIDTASKVIADSIELHDDVISRFLITKLLIDSISAMTETTKKIIG